MIRAHLGETIDIHGGGLDLIFPHHENEIAQSRCAHGGAPLANYWVHNGFVDMGAEKMSKSVGNVVLVNELLDAGHAGETLRLALLSTHYRQPLPWTESTIVQAKARLDRLYRRVGNCEAGSPDPQVVEALSNDMNTALALTRLVDVMDPPTLKASAALLGLLVRTGEDWAQKRTHNLELRAIVESAVLHVQNAVSSTIADHVVLQIESRITSRATAKANRDFAEADRIRDELAAEGVLLEDGPDGTTWRRA